MPFWFPVAARSLVDALRHPVREPVPADAVTTLEEPPVVAPSTPKSTTKLKLHGERPGRIEIDHDGRRPATPSNRGAALSIPRPSSDTYRATD